MFLTKLAFKNLARHRNRTLITASIIAFAIFFYIYLDSMIGGMVEMSYRTIIDYEAGHLQVVKAEYWEEEEKLPLDNLFVPEQRIKEVIQQVGSGAAFSPELSFQAQLYNGTDQLPVLGKGVIPEAFGTVFALENQFVEGSMVTSGQYQVVLGKRLADLLQLQTGDYITLQVKDKNKTFNTIDAEIVGLVHTSNPNVNQNIVYLPLDLVQQTLNVGDLVSKVIVRLENKNQAVKVAGKLAAELQRGGAELMVYPWTELEAVSFADAQYVENQIILVLILGIAAIAIINTVILAALERMEEIGMMKAMGLQNKEIIYTFVLESTGIGILGGLIGALLGVIGVGTLVRFGIDFDAWAGMEMASFGLPVIGKTYGVWNPEAFLKVFVFGVLISFLASILPAYWAADKDPVKAIYHR
ncbi:MAG TPA: ABC transporter permease [Firmicutes bacterium]|nr:ABC transporter permease [Bacillota bacterium]